MMDIDELELEAIDILVSKSLELDKVLYYTDKMDLQRSLKLEDTGLLDCLDLCYINIKSEDIIRG